MSGQNQTEHYPAWWYCDRRPSSDDLYFENLCRIIFQTGLNWSVVEKKWPTIKTAFLGFNVDRIAAFNDDRRKTALKRQGYNPQQIQNPCHNRERKEIPANKAPIWLLPSLPRQLGQIRQLCQSHQSISRLLRTHRSNHGSAFSFVRWRKHQAQTYVLK